MSRISVVNNFQPETDFVKVQNGAFQGGAAGAGIGAGIAGGLGTVVGSIVGGIAAIPTTGLGILIGAGTGAIHGPWVRQNNTLLLSKIV